MRSNFVDGSQLVESEESKESFRGQNFIFESVILYKINLHDFPINQSEHERSPHRLGMG